MTENVNGIEIYTNKLFEVADDFIDKILDGDIKNFKKSQSMQLIYYIHDRTERVDNDNIQGLNDLFDAYVRLCSRFGLLPTMFQFAILSGNQAATFTEWAQEQYRAKQPEYAQSSKRWKSICESFLADSLNNSDQTSVNKIFVAKSCYHWRETSPIPVEKGNVEQLTYDSLPNLGTNFLEENKDSTEN